MNPALARLRAKTDQQLCTLVSRQLQRSQALAERGDYTEAAQEFCKARALLAVARIPADEHPRLKRLLREVRQRVELPITAVA